jgi:hypothetical protein
MTIVAGAEPIERFELSRFATGSPPVLIEGLGPGEAGRLALPGDGATTPWKLRLVTAGPARACRLGGGG